MFGIGMWEMVLIAIVGLLIVTVILAVAFAGFANRPREK